MNQFYNEFLTRYIRPAENTYKLMPLYKISHVVIKDFVHTTHP